MFSRILVATDLSEASDCVIGSLGALQDLGTREIVLIHCLNLCEPSIVKNELKNLAEPYLARQADALDRQGFETTIEVASGPSPREISRIVDEKECSLVVIGSHGETKSSQILMGSEARKIINSVHKPALVVRLQLRQEKGRAVCETCRMNLSGPVLFPTDFSAIAERAFNYLRKIVSEVSNDVTLLHVQEQSHIDKESFEDRNRIAQERLSKMKTELEAIGARVEIEQTVGMPAREILSRVKEGNFSWVAIGCQDPDISHKVASQSQIPVLLIPAKP